MSATEATASAASSSSTLPRQDDKVKGAEHTAEYPPIVKGTSLMIAYRLVNRPVLLIGGGNVASGRLYFLLESGAHVTIVSPTIDPSIEYRLKTNPEDITYHPRAYQGKDDPIKVDSFAMVLTAIDDNPMSTTIFELARAAHVPVNVADVPPCCDFYFGAQLRKGPLQVMVSTGGQGPKIGAMVRDIVLNALPSNLEEAIEGVGGLRGDLRKRAPGVGGSLGQKRMDWMIGICDAWGLGEMGVLRDQDLRKRVLDEGWDKDRIVKPKDVGVGMDLRSRANDFIGKYGLGLGGLVSGIAIGSVGAVYWLRAGR